MISLSCGYIEQSEKKNYKGAFWLENPKRTTENKLVVVHSKEENWKA